MDACRSPSHEGHQISRHIAGVLRCSPLKQDGGLSDFKENHMTISIQMPTKFRVTLENYDGRCKRVTVQAFSACDAMAKCHKGGWHPVDAKEIK